MAPTKWQNRVHSGEAPWDAVDSVRPSIRSRQDGNRDSSRVPDAPGLATKPSFRSSGPVAHPPGGPQKQRNQRKSDDVTDPKYHTIDLLPFTLCAAHDGPLKGYLGSSDNGSTGFPLV